MLLGKGRVSRPKKIFYVFIVFCLFWAYQRYYGPIRFRLPVYGYASWYSRYDPGVKKRTANNEMFNDKAMTCAMWGIPFGTWLKVTNQSNGRYVIVRVNDRGPHRRYVHEGRVIDLTKTAFRQINPNRKGLIPVRVEKIRYPE